MIENSKAPQWNESFSLLVHYPEAQAGTAREDSKGLGTAWCLQAARGPLLIAVDSSQAPQLGGARSEPPCRPAPPPLIARCCRAGS